MKFNIDSVTHDAVVRLLYDLLRECNDAEEYNDGDRLIEVSSYNYACLRAVLSDLTTRKRAF